MTRTSNKIFIASAIIGFCALFIGMMSGIQASAAEKENRVLFKVVSGTATELGTDNVTNLNSSYLEEWEANTENVSVLSDKTKDYLMKAYNSDKLPVEVEEVTYESLLELAKTLMPKAEKVYQGYASLNIKDAPEGYTYSITVDGNVIKGYYVGLKNNKIYELNISFETTTWHSLKGKASTSTSQNETSGSSGSSSGNSESSSVGSGNEPITPGTPNNPGTGSSDNVAGGNTPITPGTPNNPGTGSPDNVDGGNTPIIPGKPNNPGTGSPDNVDGGNTPITPGKPNNPGTGSPDNVNGGNTPITPGKPNNPGTGSPDNVNGGNN